LVPVKWEYRVERAAPQGTLGVLNAAVISQELDNPDYADWELVSAFPIGQDSRVCILIFRRPLPEPKGLAMPGQGEFEGV
jgi:hypothetical protein